VAGAGRPKGSFSITVRRTDGRATTVDATDPIGSPAKPLRPTQFAAKFRDCAANAVRPLPQASVDSALRTIAGLERVDAARDLLTPFEK
jgi:hypothetical protein